MLIKLQLLMKKVNDYKEGNIWIFSAKSYVE